MNKRLRALHARRQKALDAGQSITAGLPENATLTDEQDQQVAAHLATARDIGIQIEEEQWEYENPGARIIHDQSMFNGSGYAGDRGGFESFGEFVHQVMRAGSPHIKSVDHRLAIGAAPTTFGSEGIGEDGGYLVPPQWESQIFSHDLESNALLPFCRVTPVSQNAMTFPVSEATPWGSSGVQTYWEGEGGLITQSKPAFEARELRLRKLTAIVPVTSELLEDGHALASWLPLELAVAARWKVNDAIVNGSGSGVPQGFTGSGALVTQAKETAQTADTIVAENITKMYARCTNPSSAVWLINPDAFSQLPLMTIGDQPVWMPVTSGLVSSPGGVLMGRPIILTDAAKTLGDAGDIYFCDLKSYAIIQKQSGPRLATSAHLWFDYDMTAFRLTFRVDGQSLIRSTVTPPNSTVTRSPFVRLAARA